MFIFGNKGKNRSNGLIDFDSFKDNAFTKHGDSLVFKFSIKNFAKETNSNLFDGLNIHFCAFFSNGVHKEHTPSFAMSRVHFSKTIERMISYKDEKFIDVLFDKHVDMSALSEGLSEDLKRKLLNVWSFSIVPYGFGCSEFNPICFTLTPNGKVRAIIKLHKEEDDTIPCISYGLDLQLNYNPNNHIPYCINNIQCGVKQEIEDNPFVATILSFCELPYEVQQLYPYSWSSQCQYL